MLNVYDLRTEYRVSPVGIDAVRPRFSWKLESDANNVMQTAYRICAYSNSELVWDSGRVESCQSQHVHWNGNELSSCQIIDWKVSVWAGDEYAESDTACFEMGLLHEEDWKAKWLEPEGDIDPDSFKPAPYLRRTFTVRPGLVKARIYQTAHGLYRFWLNGSSGTDELFMPGLTSYHKRLQYQVYDVTSLLTCGENVWAVILGDGWWRGTTGGAVRNNFGDKLAYIGQIKLEYADGSVEWIVTDENFKWNTGAWRAVDMQALECYDASMEHDGWMESGFDDSAWPNAAVADYGYGNLIASRSVSIHAHEEFTGTVVGIEEDGIVVDFGQNMAGQLSIKLHDTLPKQKITFLYGEALNKEGKFTRENIGAMSFKGELQQLDYICKGGKLESYTNLFMVCGFRYVKISGYNGPVNEGDIIAKAVYSDLDAVGDFRSSDELINRLVENARWSQKGNFLDVPTDCPTRERSPWTGDAQLYCRTAANFQAVYPFYEKYLADLAAEQHKTGRVASTAPCTQASHNWNEFHRYMAKKERGEEVPHFPPMHVDDGLFIDGAAGWGDAATIIPYTMYLCYGDIAILENQFDSAKKWVDYELAHAADENPNYADMPWYAEPEDAKWIWDTCFHFGEWLEAGIMPDRSRNPVQYPDLWVATAYMGYSARLVSKMAAILGYEDDALKYGNAADEIARVYNKYLIADDGTVVEGHQASNLRVLALGICDEAHKKAVADKLVEMINANGGHLNTGFLSTPFLLSTLTDTGHADVAYMLLEQKSSPSWLHNVIMGATTIPEGWDGLDTLHGSLNHYSYGAVCDFMFNYVAGIRLIPEKPGWQKFRIQPVPGGTLTHACAEFESPYGTIKSAWKKNNGKITYSITIPANSTAEVIIPGMEAMTLGSGEHSFTL